MEISHDWITHTRSCSCWVLGQGLEPRPSTPGHMLSPLAPLALFLVCAMFIILCQVKLAFSYWGLKYVCLIYSSFKIWSWGFLHVYVFLWVENEKHNLYCSWGAEAKAWRRLQGGCGWGQSPQEGVWWCNPFQDPGTNTGALLPNHIILAISGEQEKSSTLGELA